MSSFVSMVHMFVHWYVRCGWCDWPSGSLASQSASLAGQCMHVCTYT